MNGSSTKRPGGSVPVQTAPAIRFAESSTGAIAQPGTSANEITRAASGKRISMRVVGVSFSLGTRRTYRSYAPAADVFG
jgi:hypothetical protein